MRIASFKIKNYKSFLETEEIKLTPGFNVIVGPNNVGKTALVEALSLRFQDNPHRSLRTSRDKSSPAAGRSLVEVTFEVEKDKFVSILRPNFCVPILPLGDEKSIEKFLGISSEEYIRITGRYFSDNTLIGACAPDYGDYQSEFVARFDVDGTEIKRTDEKRSASKNVTFDFQLAQVFLGQMYRFDAERLNISRGEFGRQPHLLSNAQNLPQVINLLQTNDPSGYERLCSLFRAVFPGIWRITAPPLDTHSKDVGISVWEIDPATRRDDLARPLSDCGTGLGQVLAMLYVVLTSENPRTIIIDEPQSFLHPGAIRTLFEILRRDFSQHQYIITTHSPIVISAADPETVLLLSKPEMETQIRPINRAQDADLELCLSEVGARLSDVFGADRILWVEGATEETCFPRIIAAQTRLLLANTKILGLPHTADVTGKLADRILPLIQRLSGGGGLIPPTVAIILDQEELTEEKRTDLSRGHGGLIHFLPRRMYENYLLNPGAIAAVASQMDGFRDTDLTEAEVTEWLQEHMWDKKYFGGKVVPEEERAEELWCERVHGADLLHDLFSYFSESRVPFKPHKVSYNVILTDWLLEHGPKDVFSEITEVLKAVLSKSVGPEYVLDDLLAGVTDENHHDEVDFGPPVGKGV